MNLNSACDTVSKTICNLSPYEIWDIVLSIISVIVSSVLTALIIIQTKKLTKKQQELDKALNESQRELQQRQLKLDLYNYRREVYRNILKVYTFCINTQFFFEYENYKKLTPKTIEEYHRINEQMSYDNPAELSQILIEAKYLFPEDISDIILQIQKDFDTLLGDMNAPQKLYNIMKEEQRQTKLAPLIEEKMTDAQNRVKSILDTKDFIIEKISSELDISKLEK